MKEQNKIISNNKLREGTPKFETRVANSVFLTNNGKIKAYSAIQPCKDSNSGHNTGQYSFKREKKSL